MEINDILVPTDFSDCSLKAVEMAMSLVAPDGEIYLLNVIDKELADKFDELGLGDKDDAIESMRARANENLDSIIADNQSAATKLNKMVVIGIPFVEILKVAKDLDFSLIVMGIRGGSSPLEEILFGGTADKVLRGARIPVVCVP